MNKKPRDPFYSEGFEKTRELKDILPKPKEKDEDLNPLKKLNQKIRVYLGPNATDINENENFVPLDDEPYSSSLVRKKLFEFLNV